MQGGAAVTNDGEQGRESYDAFLARKRIAAPALGIEHVPALHPALFPFQHDLVTWALRRGRAAIWADCGLGKGWMALEWARVVAAHGRVLILAPLAVAQQFAHEAEKLGQAVTLCRDGADVRDGVNITNYDRLHRFDASSFVGVVADESSCLKDYTSATRNALIEAFARTPFRLACSATPAPNDHAELGNHAEFLGVMRRTEMLAMFFTHDGGETQKWRLKGHAEEPFWRWLTSWAVAIRSPADLGYDASAYQLPPLNITRHIVACDADLARELGTLPGMVDARTLAAQRAARRVSLDDRVALAAGLVNASREPWLVWCDLNAESDALARAIPDAVEVKGSDDADVKEARLWGFSRGDHRVIVTKPSIAGHGMNWQHCAHVAFVGVTHSFEAWYQAVRRTYRFGQTRPVACHVIVSDAERTVVENLARKQRDAERMVAGMVGAMADLSRAQLGQGQWEVAPYEPATPLMVPPWCHSEVTA